MKAKPELGIKNPYELNEDQYKAALGLLREQRKLVARYWHDAFIQIDDFKNEGVVASSSWGFQVNLLQGEKQPIASTVPAEGATGWADTTMMHVNAPHPNCAYLWMEHSINPKLQGDLSAWFGSVPAVPAACKGNKLLTDEGCARNGMNEFERIWFWRTPVTNCGGGRTCVPYYRWVTDYIAILGGR
jgi:putative spermidine/putrescine transport system substrate-binding protein